MAKPNGKREWPANSVEVWPLDKIKPYPQNARTHPPAQITLLAQLMAKRGVDQPIVVDEKGEILKGHGRRLAALEAGFTEFPVVTHRGLSKTEKRAIRLDDNQVSLLSRWDDDLIRMEIGALKLDGYDLTTLGFEAGELLGFSLDLSGVSDGDAWAGMPEFDQRDKTAFRSVVVHFKDQKAVDAFAKKTGMPITPATRFLWYPKTEIETYVDKVYRGKKK